jgi:putative membrane protein
MLSTLIAHYDGRGYGWGPGPWLFPLFLFVPLVLGLLFFRFGRFGGWHRSPSYDARSTLAARYARGEMDEDEYRRRLSVLEESGR